MVENAFWAALFIALGTVLLVARSGADAAWPVWAGALSYAAATFFLFQLLKGDRK